MAIDPRQIELSDAQKRRIAQIAEQTGRPWAEILAEVFEGCHRVNDDGVGSSDGESHYDSLSRDDLIGCIQGGPADVSSNPQYMVGFGQDDPRTSPD